MIEILVGLSGVHFSNMLKIFIRRGEFIKYENDVPLPTPQPRLWVNNPFNFDNVLEGLLTLVAIVSTEGWPE